MRKLFYCGLESYESRYTLQLQDWNERVFKRRGIDYVIVDGKHIDNSKSIQVGQVLDAHGRSYYSMSQMMNLVQMMREGQVTSEDVIFFEDMFTPGIESLPYIINQIDAAYRPKVWVRCLAQSIDPDDFIHVWNMSKWMSLYEAMVNEFVTGVLASNEEMVANMKIANWTAPLYNVSGLAFGKDEVRSRVKEIKPFHERKPRVVFASRWDQEKQPNLFMDLALLYKDVGVEFAILQGSELRSNDPDALYRARQLHNDNVIHIYENLSKNEYYEILNDSRVMINTALQDWTSNTVSEADALECNVLFPAYRSFPEIFANDHSRLYIPWSLDDVENKLRNLLVTPHKDIGKISDWTDKTIDRYLDIMIDPDNSEWSRNDTKYRNKLSEYKYR